MKSKGATSRICRAAVMGVVMFALSSVVAHATLMNYEFDVSFDTGELAGQMFTGMFTVSGYTGTGLETFRPAGSSFMSNGVLESFGITIGGIAFTLADESPDHAAVAFNDGSFEVMQFSTNRLLNDLTLNYNAAGSSLINEAYFSPDHGDTRPDSSGSITRVEPSIAAPEPAIISLLALGLSGLAFTRRKMKA